MAKKRKEKAPKPVAGDVFAVKLPDGRFGAVRVLQTAGHEKVDQVVVFPGSCLVATTPYLGTEPPSLDDPVLREILPRNFFSWNGKLALTWVEAKPSDDFTFVGNIPISEEESRIICNTYSGYWDATTGDEAYCQWRWDLDREAYVEETEARNREFMERWKNRKHRPRKMLSDDDFWALIEILDPESFVSDEQGFERLIQALSQRTKREIKYFEETLAYKLYLLDTAAHAKAYGGGSDDGFLYTRCAVVASGKAFYESVLADPLKTPDDLEFEDLLGVGRSAYERKTGEELDYETGCSYETGSNRAGWPEDT